MKNVLTLFVLIITMSSCFGQESKTIQKTSKVDAKEILNSLEKLSSKDLLVVNTNGKVTIEKGLASFSFSQKIAVGDEVCSGDGIGFARCVKKVVDAGTCVTIGTSGDDYIAVEAECPE